jgi:hypothetical protein
MKSTQFSNEPYEFAGEIAAAVHLPFIWRIFSAL